MPADSHRFPALGDTGGQSPAMTAAVVAEVRSTTGTACAACGARLCGHDAVLSIVLGYRHGARCHGCLAAAMTEEIGSLVGRVCQYLRRRDCYRAGWSWANRDEGFADEEPGAPPCIQRSMSDTSTSAATVEPAGLPTSDDPAVLPVAAEWDAGDIGCGDLVLELRLKVKRMQPGEILRVTASDPGAPTDIPAWCGLTGHALRASVHPDYWIQRKDG